MIRAFLALPVPDDISDRLSILQHRLPLARPVPRENFHITLAFLGEQSEDTLEELDAELSLKSLAAPMLKIDGLGVFGGDAPRNLHANIAANETLTALQSRLAQLVRRSGVSLERRKFVPHVTLARFRVGEVGPDLLARALEKTGPVAIGPFGVGEMGLYRSTLRHDAPPLYDLLASYPLTP